MKAIELTEEHKAKLLEMCNKLFPKHCKFEFFTEDLRFLNEETDEFLTFIHWFEFCMTHLVEKLIEVINEYESKLSDSKREKFFIEIFEPYELLMSIKDKHPIDYLYEEFKKLK
jgi:hypothetical protein